MSCILTTTGLGVARACLSTEATARSSTVQRGRTITRLAPGARAAGTGAGAGTPAIPPAPAAIH